MSYDMFDHPGHLVGLIFVLMFGFLTPVMIYGWMQYEEVLYDMSCKEIKFALQNKEPETQMIWHYNDRCLND